MIPCCYSLFCVLFFDSCRIFPVFVLFVHVYDIPDMISFEVLIWGVEDTRSRLHCFLPGGSLTDDAHDINILSGPQICHMSQDTIFLRPIGSYFGFTPEQSRLLPNLVCCGSAAIHYVSGICLLERSGALGLMSCR